MKKEKKNKSYFAILRTAKELFWKHGVSRITVEEICREASVSKMTFYRLFKNKNDVAAVVLSNYFDEVSNDYDQIMKEDISFAEKMRRLVILKQQESDNLSEEFIKDIFLKEDSILKEKIEQLQEIRKNVFIKHIKEAQEKGEIRSDIKLEFIIYMLNSMTEMIFKPEIQEIYPNVHKAIMEITNFFFYGLSQNNE